MREIIVGSEELKLEDILAVARGEAKVSISRDKNFIRRVEDSQKLLFKAMEEDIPVYGVTTGFGKSCGKRMLMEAAVKNGDNLIKFHGCGTGAPLSIEEARAAVFSRILCFARGYSGVSVELLQTMADFLNNDIVPVMPSEGSVGASGDLTPMSYVAAALKGDREVFYKGKRVPAKEAIESAGLKPYSFNPKEPLAIMNGTAAMCGISAIAVERSRRILGASIMATALTIHALKGNDHHYYPAIGKSKPHPGQIWIAEKILSLLEVNGPRHGLEANELDTLQDPYSIRCAPQILGVLSDSLAWIEEWVEIESNSANDNPIFDAETGCVLMGGNFYGGHIAFAMDGLKSAVASAADMCDRQVMLMVTPNINRGLPADLVSVQGNERMYNHGFKAMSIASSSLAAEALKLTMPAASFSRSTESHNQDKVSMGTISARDAMRVCELTERVTAIHLLAAVQACEIRGTLKSRPKLEAIAAGIRAIARGVSEDRPMDEDIEKVVRAIRKSDLYTA